MSSSHSSDCVFLPSVSPLLQPNSASPHVCCWRAAVLPLAALREASPRQASGEGRLSRGMQAGRICSETLQWLQGWGSLVWKAGRHESARREEQWCFPGRAPPGAQIWAHSREGGILWTGGQGSGVGLGGGWGGGCRTRARGRWCSRSRARTGEQVTTAAAHPGCGLDSRTGARRREGWSGSWTGPRPVGGACDWGGQREVWKNKESLLSSSLGQSTPTLPASLLFWPAWWERTASVLALGCCWEGKVASGHQIWQLQLPASVTDDFTVTSVRICLNGNGIALDRESSEAHCVLGPVRGRN